MEEFIKIAANAYFWVFVSLFILRTLTVLLKTESYKLEEESDKLKAKQGRYDGGISVHTFFMYVLWVISMYYR